LLYFSALYCIVVVFYFHLKITVTALCSIVQVSVAATAAYGGCCLHAVAFTDGEVQMLSATGDVVASARVFENSPP
jgi:hypothetical protein